MNNPEVLEEIKGLIGEKNLGKIKKISKKLENNLMKQLDEIPLDEDINFDLEFDFDGEELDLKDLDMDE
jgi:hypothetical protein